MEAGIHTQSQNQQAQDSGIAEIREKLADALDSFEIHQELGDTGGAWFHYGIALGLHQTLVVLGEDDVSDFPGADPIAVAMEAPKEERAAYLHLVWEALGDMDFADDVPDGMEEELRIYQEGWRKRVAEEGR